MALDVTQKGAYGLLNAILKFGNPGLRFYTSYHSIQIVANLKRAVFVNGVRNIRLFFEKRWLLWFQAYAKDHFLASLRVRDKDCE